MNGGPRPGEAPATRWRQEADPRRWKALTVCLVAGFMTLLDDNVSKRHAGRPGEDTSFTGHDQTAPTLNDVRQVRDAFAR